MFSFRTTPLEDQLDRALLDGKVGCFCTQNCWDVSGRGYMYEIFRKRGNLAALMAPKGAEPGLNGSWTAPAPQVLEKLSAVVVEIQDNGARYCAQSAEVFALMDMLAGMGPDAPALYIVDHVNPVGRFVEGSMPSGPCDASVLRVAHRHGLTLGELCNLYASESSYPFSLHVISCMATPSNRVLLPWTIAPSPEFSGMFTCNMYVGGALWEDTSVTPGLGTPRPYEYIGAPFIEPDMDSVPYPDGTVMRPCSFVPAAGKYVGEVCRGYQIILLPGAEYHSLLHTLHLVRYFRERYDRFTLGEGFFSRLADPVLKDYVDGKISFQDAREHVKAEEQKWIRKARRYALYDDPPVRMKKS